MSDLDTVLYAYRIRDAIVQMTIRYGSSMQSAAYAERRVRDGEAQAQESYLRHSRAAKRRSRAIQWLAAAAVRVVKDGGFAAGSALLVPREIRHDTRTAQSLARFRRQLDGTDAAVLAAVDVVDRMPDGHPLCAEFRAIVDAELAARHLSLAPLAGGE